MVAAPASAISPERAEEKRAAIRDSVSQARAEGQWVDVAESLEEDAASLGDPVTMLEAGAAWLEAAQAQSDVDYVERGVEATRTALDMLYFYRDVANQSVRSQWRVIEPSRAQGLIEDGRAQLERAEEVLDAIENPKSGERGAKASQRKGKKRQSKRRRDKQPAKPGTGLLAAGGVMTVLGAGGGGLAIAGLTLSLSKQREVEELDPVADADRVATLDEEGDRANLFAYIGLGVAGGGLAIGIPMLVVGALRRKRGQPRQTWLILPRMSADSPGVTFLGQF